MKRAGAKRRLRRWRGAAAPEARSSSPEVRKVTAELDGLLEVRKMVFDPRFIELSEITRINS